MFNLTPRELLGDDAQFFFMAALRSRCRHYIFIMWFLLSSFFLLSFFSSPNFSRNRLYVYHTCTHGVALVMAALWPANFNGFRVLAALLHGTLVAGVSQTAAFNRGRHLYSAGRPSGWALAHISSFALFQGSRVRCRRKTISSVSKSTFNSL